MNISLNFFESFSSLTLVLLFEDSQERSYNSGILLQILSFLVQFLCLVVTMEICVYIQKKSAQVSQKNLFKIIFKIFL